MEIDYCVIDVETTIRNKSVGDFPGSPFWPANHIWLAGAKNAGDMLIAKHPFYDAFIDFIGYADTWVGQNLAFDMHYMSRLWEPTIDSMVSNLRIFDTQMAEFILSGQSIRGASLDELAAAYGGTLKDDRLKDMWKAGVQTEDIDDDIIIPYLEKDLENTELVFLAQCKRIDERGIWPLVWAMMDSRLATWEMERNGIHFLKERAMERANEELAELEKLKSSLVDMVKHRFPTGFWTSINLGSSQQIAALLFGGEVAYTVRRPVVDDDGYEYVYKTGKKKGMVKERNEKDIGTVRDFGVKPKEDWKTKTGHSTNDDVLKEVIQKEKGEVSEFLTGLIEVRNKEKQISTYLLGYSELTWPDGMIRTRYNHTRIPTGRLSSSSPNLQNITRKRDD